MSQILSSVVRGPQQVLTGWTGLRLARPWPEGGAPSWRELREGVCVSSFVAVLKEVGTLLPIKSCGEGVFLKIGVPFGRIHSSGSETQRVWLSFIQPRDGSLVSLFE